MRAIEKYLRTRSFAGPWTLEGAGKEAFDAAIVIPALAERSRLPETLASLARNPAHLLDRTLVVIVVNHRPGVSDDIVEDNRRTLSWLQSEPYPELQLSWVDAASSGCELPAGEGVGLARKIGFDLTMRYLRWDEDPLLISLDADSLVDGSYLAAIFSYFEQKSHGGAVLPFRHQCSADSVCEQAIRDYELYLRSYTFGLQCAGSPYAYHSIGSTICCRAAAYIKVGGMNRRLAAEDFYFLQQLAKVSAVGKLAGTVVRPAPRFSDRVPFGTGRTLQKQVEQGGRSYQLVGKEQFEVLKGWLELIESHVDRTAAEISGEAGNLSRPLVEFLDELNFHRAWENLQKNHAGPVQRKKAFHDWFDALRTRQLLTRVGHASSVSVNVLTSELLEWGGVEAPGDCKSQLEVLELLQGVRS